jgi:hypothetical protein
MVVEGRIQAPASDRASTPKNVRPATDDYESQLATDTDVPLL